MVKYLVFWKGHAGQDVWREVSEDKLKGEIQRLKSKGYNPMFRVAGDPRSPWRTEVE